MKKEKEILSEFNIYKNLESQIIEKRKQRKWALLAITIVIYSIVSILVASVTVWDSDFLSFNRREEDNSLENLYIDLESMRKEFDKLESSILTEKPINNSITLLNSKLNDLEFRQQNIEQTILDNPEKAITSRLLRDKQISIEEGVKEIKESQIRINDKMDNIIIFGLLVPIISWLLPYIGRFVVNKKQETGEI